MGGHETMRTLPFLTLISLAATLVAGCSDGAPSGELMATGERPVVDGTVDIAYQAAVRPLSENTGGVADQCTPDELPEGTPLDMGRCQDPYSRFEIHMMTLPAADAAGYSVYLANATGEEMSLGTLDAIEAGMFEAEFNQTEDLMGDFESVEIRAGSFVLARAPSAAGMQPFELDANATSLQVAGTYSGRTLTLEVSGLQANVTYTGRLYAADDAGLLSPVESFSVGAGETVYEAEENIAGYAEFHLHVGATSINVYKATIG